MSFKCYHLRGRGSFASFGMCVCMYVTKISNVGNVRHDMQKPAQTQVWNGPHDTQADTMLVKRMYNY